MLKRLRQIRSAFALLNPEEVRRVANHPLQIGLVAASPSAYAEMEDFLLPATVSHIHRLATMERIHRAGDQDLPGKFDLVLYDPALPAPGDAFLFHRDNPRRTVDEVLLARNDLGLPLARTSPPFRRSVVDSIVHAVSKENALFAVATALPNVVPNLIELPWAVSEFASDTAFITFNQIRMAFLIAGACGGPMGFSEQKAEVASIVAGAFGWRTLARELAGKMPFGTGLVAKGGIAFAGTYVIGKGLAHLHHAGRNHTAVERRAAYAEGLEKGRNMIRGALEPPSAAG